jgi:hypothetical protein
VKASLNADGHPIATDTLPPVLLYWGMQPGLILFVYAAGAGLLPGLGIYAALLISFVALTLAERAWPARREWTQNGSEWGQVLAMFAINAGAMALIEYGLPLPP